jgi:hypothetical protein
MNRGDQVRRKSGRDKRVGVIVALYNDGTSARVRWPDKTRIGGNGYFHSTIALKSLVRVEEARG